MCLNIRMNQKAIVIIYSIECKMVIKSSADKSKTDMLSDIRAIEGVTIVTLRDHKIISGNNISAFTLKFDLSPLLKKSIRENLLRIKKEVMRIPGVTRFEYLSRPQPVG